MTPITFTAYNGFGRKVVIIAERIIAFHRIDYNGNSGTCITLDNGKEINVSDSTGTVKMAIDQIKLAEGK